jgi:uncharacterized protein (DUF2141 family)
LKSFEILVTIYYTFGASLFGQCEGKFTKMNYVSLKLTLIALFLTSAAFAQGYKIGVTVTGLRNDQGKVYFSLYRSAQGYPKQPAAAFRLLAGSIVKNKCIVEFDNIPKGIYAIACFHDENNNGKLDANFIGIPKEGTGASNNAKGSMGPPKFRDAQFIVDNDVNQRIKINY